MAKALQRHSHFISPRSSRLDRRPTLQHLASTSLCAVALLTGCMAGGGESDYLTEVEAAQAAKDKNATRCDFGAAPIESGVLYSVNVFDSDLKDNKDYAVDVALAGGNEAASAVADVKDGQLVVQVTPWAAGTGVLTAYEVKEKKGAIERKLKAQCTFEVVDACVPAECQPLQCAAVDDGCGGTLDCGACGAGFFCGGGNRCEACGSLECTADQCGVVGDECGSIDCGACAEGEVCNQNNRCEVDVGSQQWCIGEDTDVPPDESGLVQCTICGLRNLKIENWENNGPCVQAWRRVAWEDHNSPECRRTTEEMQDVCCGDYPRHPARAQCVDQPGPYESIDLCADGCFPSEPARAGVYSINAGGPLAPWVKSLGDRRGTCYQDDGGASGGFVWTCRRAYYLLKYGHLPPAQAREVVSWWSGGHALSVDCGCDGDNTNNPDNQ